MDDNLPEYNDTFLSRLLLVIFRGTVGLSSNLQLSDKEQNVCYKTKGLLSVIPRH